MLDLDQFDAGRYGELRVGKHLTVPCVYASSFSDGIPENNERKRFLLDICHNSKDLGNGYAKVFQDGMCLTVARRQSAKYHNNRLNPEVNVYPSLVLDGLDVKNAYIMHTTKDDEPTDSHRRDHLYSVMLHGKLRYRMHQNCENASIVEGKSDLGFSFDYNWRLGRHKGDIRSWPLIDAEVLDWHTDHGFLDKDLQKCDGMTVRINTFEGPLVLFIHKVWGTYMADMSVNRFLATLGYRHVDCLAHQLLLTHLVYKLIDRGMSRKDAFDLLKVYPDEVWPVTGPNWGTFDDPPALIKSDVKLWDKTQYRLMGENIYEKPGYPGQQEDVAKFWEQHPLTKWVLNDVDFLWSKVDSIDDLICERRELMRYPRHGIYEKMAKLVPKEEIPPDVLERCNDTSRWEYSRLYREFDWMGSWTRQNGIRTDCELLVRLGLLPCLPRVTLDWPYKKYISTWLSAYSMRVKPVAVFQWRTMLDNADGWQRLEDALGYALDHEQVQEDLIANMCAEGKARDSSVFVLGVVELHAKTKEQILKMCKHTLGESFGVL